MGHSFGQCTFFRQGAKSLIDYTVTSDFFFDKISELIINPLTYFSDHYQVVTNISIPKDTKVDFSHKTYYKWKKLPNLFHWNKSSTEAYRAAFSSKEMKAKVQTSLATSFTNNSEGIEKANRTLIDIMLDPAKHSLPMKRQKNKKKYKNIKWFDNECEKAREMFKKAANNANRNPLDTDLTKKTSEKLKELKKICKKQQSSF